MIDELCELSEEECQSSALFLHTRDRTQTHEWLAVALINTAYLSLPRNR